VIQVGFTIYKRITNSYDSKCLDDSATKTSFTSSALQPVCTVHLTLGCTKICVGCTTTKGFTKVHHKLVTLSRYFLQKLSVSKHEPLTNQ